MKQKWFYLKFPNVYIMIEWGAIWRISFVWAAYDKRVKP